MSSLVVLANEYCSCCQVDKGSFQENSCKIIFPRGQKEWVGYSGTLLQGNHSISGKLADVLLFWDKNKEAIGLAYSIELKKSRFDVSGVVEQIQAGARFVERVAEGAEVDFFPVLVHAKGIPQISIRRLRDKRVKFRGKNFMISIARSGTRVEEI